MKVNGKKSQQMPYHDGLVGIRGRVRGSLVRRTMGGRVNVVSLFADKANIALMALVDGRITTRGSTKVICIWNILCSCLKNRNWFSVATFGDSDRRYGLSVGDAVGRTLIHGKAVAAVTQRRGSDNIATDAAVEVAHVCIAGGRGGVGDGRLQLKQLAAGVGSEEAL